MCNLLFSFLQNSCCPRQVKTNIPSKKVEQMGLFYGDMMFITSIPSPFHLRQLANVIYQAVMDDTGVAEVHLARLEHELSLFLRVSSLVLGMEILP